jgi:hypothetical protein
VIHQIPHFNRIGEYRKTLFDLRSVINATSRARGAEQSTAVDAALTALRSFMCFHLAMFDVIPKQGFVS